MNTINIISDDTKIFLQKISEFAKNQTELQNITQGEEINNIVNQINNNFNISPEEYAKLENALWFNKNIDKISIKIDNILIKSKKNFTFQLIEEVQVAINELNQLKIIFYKKSASN